jgi:UDP-N-acetyl-D-mannosaminuronic acid transferase (WecB/TagA/CpsF family)
LAAFCQKLKRWGWVGVQERLGYALRKQLSYKPAILCLGAAIAFLSGGQANIPNWADRLMLGWLRVIGRH